MTDSAGPERGVPPRPAHPPRVLVRGLLFVMVVSAAAMAPALLLGRVPAQTDWILGYGPWSPGPNATVHNPGGGDDFFVYVPDRIAAVKEWRRGRLPLWNPYVSAGVPFLGMQTANPLDPLILLELILPEGFALGIAYGLLMFLAGLGVVLYLRDRGVRRAGALALAGGAFALNPYFVMWLENRVFLAGLALLPIALWALERVVSRRGGRRECAVLALSLGYSALGGTLQTAALFLLALVVRLGWLCMTDPGGDEARPRARGVSALLAALLAGLALGSLPLIAGWELLAHSTRLGPEGYYAHNNYLSLRAAALWFSPEVFGFPREGTFSALDDFHRYYSSGSGWGAIGAVPLGLAGFAVIRRAGPRGERLFWGGLAVLTLVFLFLQRSPLHAGLLRVLPWLDDVDLLRGLIVVNLAGAVLAGFGAAELGGLWERGEPRRRWLLPWAGFLLAGIAVIGAGRWGLPPVHPIVRDLLPFLVPVAVTGAIGLAPRGWKPLAGTRLWWLAGLAVFELGRVHFIQNTFSPPGLTYPVHPAIEDIQARLGSPDHPRYLVRGAYRILPPNVGSVFGLPDVRGYSNVPIARYRHLLEFAEGKSASTNLPILVAVTSPIYRLLGVTYVFSGEPLDDPLLEPVGGPWRSAFYRRLEPLPRAFLVHDLRAVSGEAEMRRVLSDPGFDPAARVYVESAAGPLPAARQPLGSEGVRIESLEPTGMRIAVSADAPGMLVVADPFYPGWRAWVDGRKARIYPADWALRGVGVDPGEHEVILRYRPPWLGYGAAASVLALVVIAAGLVPRRGHPPGPSAS